jgi:hypothetical protein
MKKKIRLIVTAIIVLVIGMVFFLSNHTAPQDEMQEMLNRVEDALGDDWKKQTVTEVSNLVYSDDEGNTIIYYVCVTTYYEADANNQSGLNIEAISAVIKPEEAESSRECTVTDLPAAIYQKDGRAYLCWTIMPELSCVIEYNPAIESEATMFRMAESVPANDNR